MAINAMAEEVFRFSVVRNPARVPPERLRQTAVRIVPEAPGPEYRYSVALAALRKDGAARGAIVAHAARFMAAPEFGARLRALNTPLWRFAERLSALARPRASDLADLVVEVFGRDAAAVAADPAFQADAVAVADSLVLVAVAAPPVPGLRTRLMEGRRAVALLQGLAAARAEDGAAALGLRAATLLLPPAIFPLPDANARTRAANAEAHARRKAALEERTARAQRALEALGTNTAVAEELTGTLSRHLFDVMRESPGEPRRAAPLSVLPPGRVEGLSASAKKVVLEELRIPATAVDVPFVVDQLERSNLKLGQELATRLDGLLVSPGPFAITTCGECATVVLPEPKPENDFTPETRGEVEVVGIQDLLIVRQKLLDYRVGEISHVENVLQGEKKGTTHRKLNRTELTTVQESEKERLLENELQTTDKYELQTEAARVLQEDRSVEAGVTVTASYGPVKVEAHGSYAGAQSTEESRRSASTFAREVVSRSLERVRERVATRTTRSELTEVEITNLHRFDNTDGAGHVSGVYRWVDKRYQAQILNYGRRLMLEFMIPEPAAFQRWATARKRTPAPDVPRPERPGFCRNGVFHPLSPADLQPENYLCFVARYNVKNVNAPSPRYVRVSDVLKYKIDATQGEPVAFAETNDSFKIPDGYAPKAVSYTISGGNAHSATFHNEDHDDNMLAMVAIADRKVFRYYRNEIGAAGGSDVWPDIGQVIEWGNPLSTVEQQLGSYQAGSLSGEFPLPSSSDGKGDPDVIKVSITGHTTLPLSVTVHYTVLCERTLTKFQQWQLETFNAIVDAYAALRSEYDDAVRSALAAATEQTLQGRNPALNREVERRELKKGAISLLTGQQYDSFNAMEEDPQTGAPQLDLADAAAEGRFVRFFEQALEWTNLTYVFYPYFWGRKDRWADVVAAEDPDPLHQKFLQAGYARVWAPVRPGFEAVVLQYVELGGEPWTEKDAPLLGEPDEGSAPAVALIEELKAELGADFDARPGTIEVHAGSTLVAGTGTDFGPDDVDRAILIALQEYRITAVDQATQQLTLREPFAGEGADGLGYAVGAKYVGEPWIVQVPTSLVHLRDGADLIGG
ncbi:MAG TPA: hypothetical protein VEB43_11975 [Anaeromyxobacter sp.]|nr:hypothetical protein [Anaeromyxobacter sp.]